MIHISNLIPEFRQADFQAVVERTPFAELRYREYFPLAFSPKLNFSTLESNTGLKVMADISAMDSRAKRKGRDFVEKMSGEIPKIEIARDLKEKEQMDLQELRHAASLHPSNQGVANQLISRIYEDPIFCRDGVNARLEFMAKQLASTGKYGLKSEKDTFNIDFGINTIKPKITWFDKANAETFDPIADLREAQEMAMKKGFRFTSALMDMATFYQFKKAKSVAKFTASYMQVLAGLTQEPTLEQINNALTLNQLPTISLWESYINEEGEDGSLVVQSGWKLGNILLSSTPVLGNTLYTTSPEFSTNLGDTMSQTISDHFILVKSFGIQEPFLISTKALAFAVPVFNNTKQRTILQSKKD